MNKYAARRSNVVELKFFLKSDDSGPAENTDIDIDAGETAILFKVYIGEPPKEPQRPRKARPESIRNRILQTALSPLTRPSAEHFESRMCPAQQSQESLTVLELSITFIFTLS
jgi:hypothetical protein